MVPAMQEVEMNLGVPLPLKFPIMDRGGVFGFEAQPDAPGCSSHVLDASHFEGHG